MEIKRYSKNLFKVFDDYVEIYIHDYKTKKLLGTIKVDLEDFDLVRNYKWCFTRDKWGHARNREVGLMHRFILKPKQDELIDHINEDALDNRRCNLRIANKSLNAYNNSKARSDCKTGVRGVTQRRNKYRATIRISGKQTHLGDFDTIEQAKEIYESYRREMINI